LGGDIRIEHSAQPAAFAFAVVLAFLVCHSRRESASVVAFALKGRGFSRAVTVTNVSGL
jgi:hypothetical protein